MLRFWMARWFIREHRCWLRKWRIEHPASLQLTSPGHSYRNYSDGLSHPASLAVFPSRLLSSIVLRLSGGSELLRTRGYSPLFPSVHVQFSLSGRPRSVCIIALIFVFLMRSCLSQSENFSIQFHSLSRVCFDVLSLLLVWYGSSQLPSLFPTCPLFWGMGRGNLGRASQPGHFYFWLRT